MVSRLFDEKIKLFANIIKDKDMEGLENFTWVLDSDKKVLKLDNKDVSSINYSLPTVYSGKIEDADLYICLYNPGIDFTKEQVDDGISTKDFLEKDGIAEGLKNVNLYVKNYIYREENVLYEEMLNLKKEYKTREKILNSSYSELTQISYYLCSYYYKVFVGSEGFISKQECVANAFDKGLDYFKDLKVCNLELIPYRTLSKSQIMYQKGKSIVNLEVVKESVEVIKKRIDKYESNKANENKPMFVFRMYPDWKKVFKSEYGEKCLINMEKYFYEFTTNSIVGEEYIAKVLDEADKNNLNGIF